MKSLARTFATALFMALGMLALALPRIEVRSAADLVALNDPAWVDVVEDIDLTGKTITVPAGSVVAFTSGSFIGGTVHFEDASVQVELEGVFRGTEVTGTLRNAVVCAEWWGIDSADASAAVNKALRFAGARNTVTLGERKYTVKTPIKLDTNGQRFRCEGELLLAGTGVAVDVSASFVGLSVSAIRGSQKLDDTASYRGTGVLFSANTYNSNISLGELTDLERGLDFTPMPVGDNVAGTQYLKIDFELIRARYGIYIDVCKKPVTLGKSVNVWMNENQFSGGRIEGDYGIYVSSPADYGVGYVNPQDRINGNVFSNITFQNISKLPIRLWHCSFDRFSNITMASQLPVGPWVSVEDCRLVDFDIVGGIAGDKIQAGADCYRVCFDNPILPAASGTYPKLTLYPLAAATGSPSLKFVTVGTGPYNALNNLTLNKEQNDWSVLFTHIDGVMLLNDVCNITVPADLHATVDTTGLEGVLQSPITVLVTLSHGATLHIAGQTVPASGAYRLWRDATWHLRPIQ